MTFLLSSYHYCSCNKDETPPKRLSLNNKNDNNNKKNAINIHRQEILKALFLMKVKKFKFEFHVMVRHGEVDEKKSTSV